MDDLTVKQVQDINNINTNTQKMKLGNKIQQIISELNEATVNGTPVNAVNASETLTLSGVVVHGETLTINNPIVEGSDTYEFLADTAQTKSDDGNIAVDITAYTTKSSGTLTVATQPTSGDKMVIGSKTYTFVPVGTANADGEISIGADLTGAQANIVTAINGTDGINTPNSQVRASAFAANVSTITALIGGTIGDIIPTTETFAAVGNVFGAVTLGSGADCSAANAIIALVGAITGSDTQGVGATDGTGDTVVLTADVAGVTGNDIVIGETLANGAFTAGAIVLSGGIDGTIGFVGQAMIDDSYEYRCTVGNTKSGKNWRRISLGSVY